MQIVPAQCGLFDQAPELPAGLVYEADFLTPAEESDLLAEIARLPFREARFQQYTARRRVVRFGEGEYPASYGAAAEELNPRRPFPEFLMGIRQRVAHWRGLGETDFAHALVTEYQPGTPIGGHSDAPHFDIIVGISLAGAVRMRFRPYAARNDKNAAIELQLAQRSAYVMQGDIRWKWQHHIPPAKQLRYSITLRTLKQDAARGTRSARANRQAEVRADVAAKA